MHSTNYADNQITSVIRHLMFGGMPYNGNFCYQFMLNVKGAPDNVFGMLFNVKSKIQKRFKSNNLHIYAKLCGLCHDDVLTQICMESHHYVSFGVLSAASW